MAESHDLSERVNLYTDGKIYDDSVSMKYKPLGENRRASTEIAFKFCRREDSKSLVMMQRIEMRLKPIDVASRSTSHNRGMKEIKAFVNTSRSLEFTYELPFHIALIIDTILLL